MKKLKLSYGVAIALALVMARGSALRAQEAPAAAQAPQQVATVEQLKTEAFAALKSGQFAQSSELIDRAASMSHDPITSQMSAWVKQFESQRQQFATERHKQYDKSVADVQKLLAAHQESFARDAAASAYSPEAVPWRSRSGL